MECFLEYIKIPKEINIEESEEELDVDSFVKIVEE